MIFRKSWILLTGLLALILGGSLFLNFILYRQAKKYYLEVNETRLDPVGLGYYPETLEIATDRPRIVFFGDSRAASWVSPNLKEYTFINRGINSQTSVQTIQRFASHVRPLKPKIVIVQVGVNDLKTIALFPGRRDEIVNRCKANIQQIVEASRRLGAVAIVTTIFPVGDVPLERKPFWSEEIDRAVKEVNTYIASLANDRTLVFDTFSLLADRQGKLLQQYSWDELHLNELGYAKLNEALVPMIKQVK